MRNQLHATEACHNINEGYDVVITSAEDGRAWHKLDQPFEHEITWQEAYLKVGAYHPHKVSLTLPTGQRSAAYSVVRLDPTKPGTDELIELGPGVSEDYVVYDNEKLFALTQRFLESGQCYITTAGTLRKGADIWVCMRIKEEFLLDNTKNLAGVQDAVRPFILFRNTHDAGRSLRLTISGVRTVCNNTVVSAERGMGISIPHLGAMETNVEKCVELIDVANQRLSATVEQYCYLQGVDINQAELEKFVVKTLSTEKLEAGMDDLIAGSELSAEQLAKKRAEFEAALFPRAKEKITENFSTAPGCDSRSLFGAVSAVTYWTTHQRGISDETRFRNLHFGGDSHRVNSRALRVALEIAKSKA